MKGKSALVTENVQRLAPGVLRRRGIVLALIQERAGFLPFHSVEVKLDAIHGKDSIALFSLNYAGKPGRKLLEFANPGIYSLNDRRRLQLFAQFRQDSATHRLSVHRLREDLERQQVVVAVHNQSRQEIRLAKNHTICIRVFYDPFAIGDRRLNPSPEQTAQIAD